MKAEVTNSGKRISKAFARTICRELARIRKRDGVVTPAQVVAAAEDSRSPLHHYFQWNDRKAAAAHRLAQASELIRSVSIIFRADPSDKPRIIRAWVPVNTPAGRGYVPTLEAMEEPDQRQQMLDDALRELRVWREKYRMLSELARVFEVADTTAKR